MTLISKRESNKRERSQKILEIAEAVFLEKGVNEVTMDEIAALAEMSKATLYVYYRSKDELFKEIAKKGHQLLLKKFTIAISDAKSGADKVRKMGITFFEFAQQQPEYYRFLSFFDPAGPKKLQRVATLMVLDIVAYLSNCLNEGINDGSIHSDINPAITAKSLWGMASGLVQLLSVKGDIIEKETGVMEQQLLQNFFDIIERSLMTEPRSSS
jgi:AcrR family transcriptional regulator